MIREWSGRWESNPRLKLGKLGYYHYTTPASKFILVGLHRVGNSMNPAVVCQTDARARSKLRKHTLPVVTSTGEGAAPESGRLKTPIKNRFRPQ